MNPHTRDESGQGGATATEYLMLMALIALVIVVGATTYGVTLEGAFSDSGDQVNDELDTTSG